MKLWALILAFFLTGCAAGFRTSNFPNGGSLETSAQVTVYRTGALWATALTPKVVLDGWAIAELGRKEHVTFYVPPGQHTIGLSTSMLTMAFEQGKRYFFEVSIDPTWTGFEIERLRYGQAGRLLRGSKAI